MPFHVQSFRLHPRVSRSKQDLMELLRPPAANRQMNWGPKTNPGYQQSLAVPLAAIQT